MLYFVMLMPQKQHQSSCMILNEYNQIIIWGGGTGHVSKISLVWTESTKHPDVVMIKKGQLEVIIGNTYKLQQLTTNFTTIWMWSILFYCCSIELFYYYHWTSSNPGYLSCFPVKILEYTKGEVLSCLCVKQAPHTKWVFPAWHLLVWQCY